MASPTSVARSPLGRWLPLALAGVVVAVILAGRHLPPLAPPAPVHPGLLLVLAGALLAASLYRPLKPPEGGGAEPEAALRLGTAAAPLLFSLAGTAVTAAVGALAVMVQPVAEHLAGRLPGLAREGSLRLPLAEAATTGLALLAAGLAWASLGLPTDPAGAASWLPTLFAGATGLVVAAALRAGLDAARSGGPPSLSSILGGGNLALEALGWALGAIPAAVAQGARPSLAAAVSAGGAVLLLEAERQRLAHAATRRRLTELDRVRRAGHRMASGERELESVVESIATECAHVLPWLWFQLDLHHPDDETRSWSAGPATPLTAGIARPDPHPPVLPGMHRRAAWRVIERPLPREEKAFAQLRLWCDPRRLDEEDLPLLDSLLPHLAASLERALLDREARQDPLTGVAVRRVLERRLQEVYARILEEGGLMAVLMCDLDHFKRINDRWGHGTGDRALQAAARAFESALRSKPSGKDLLARYGGEEFTVLLDGTGGEEALAVGERLRRAVDVLDFRDEEGGTAIPLSASVGVAAFPELHIKTATELLLLADGALYEAKRQGRNQCLLGLGRGRYRRGDGELVTGSELPQQTSLPNFFS